MQPSGEPTPALRGKDATVDRAASRPERVAAIAACLRQNVWASAGGQGQRWAPVSRGGAHRDQAWRTFDLDPRPFTPRLGRRSASRRMQRWCSYLTAARGVLLAAFNGFLAIKSMRLFTLRTVSVGKPAGAPDVSMRSRWSAAAGQAGRRSCCRAGSRPDDRARRSLAAWQTSTRPSAVVAGRKADGWL
jgi:hypothetical protein